MLFRSREFMNINSMTFLDSPSIRIHEWEMCGVKFQRNVYCRFKQVKFINLGIMLFKKRSGGQYGNENIFDEYSNFSANAKDLLETLPEGCKGPIYKVFIRKFGRFAKANRIRLPWFVPRSYGGVGLTPYGSHQPSPQDLSICKLFREKGTHFQIVKKESNWILHKRFLELMDSCNLPLVDDSSGYDVFYGRMMVNMYLAACADGRVMSDLWKDAQETTNHAIRRAEKLWKKASCYSSLPSAKDFDPWGAEAQPKRPLILESDWSHVWCDFSGLAPFASIAME